MASVPAALNTLNSYAKLTLKSLLNLSRQMKLRKPSHPLFRPQDRYFVNEQGWWFYTVDKSTDHIKQKPIAFPPAGFTFSDATAC